MKWRELVPDPHLLPERVVEILDSLEGLVSVPEHITFSKGVSEDIARLRAWLKRAGTLLTYHEKNLVLGTITRRYK